MNTSWSDILVLKFKTPRKLTMVGNHGSWMPYHRSSKNQSKKLLPDRINNFILLAGWQRCAPSQQYMELVIKVIIIAFKYEEVARCKNRKCLLRDPRMDCLGHSPRYSSRDLNSLPQTGNEMKLKTQTPSVYIFSGKSDDYVITPRRVGGWDRVG